MVSLMLNRESPELNNRKSGFKKFQEQRCMNDELTNKSVPVIKGLFTWPTENPQLIGTRCLSCNSYYFPTKPTCSNPNCQEKKVQEVLLSTEGKLWSFTVLRYPPSPPFKNDQKPPYPVGLVELPEGIRVMGLITGCEVDKVKIGMNMKLVVETLYKNEEGQDVLTWKFKPTSA
jgi:uncharacterized protein